LTTLKEIFRDEFAAAKKPEEKAALAGKLLKQAAESHDDAASHYVLLSESQTLAIDAADVDLLVRITSELGSHFSVDALQLLSEDLENSALKAHPAPAFKPLADAALERIDEALANERFELAKRFADAGLAAARKAKDAATLKLALDRGKSLAAAKQQFDAAQEAATTLARLPEDAEANLALGRYLCFVRGDWSAGLEKLAKASDATLRDLAAKGVADPQDAAAQAELGEAWAKAADAAKAKAKIELQSGARYWYAKALPGLTGLIKARAEQRLKAFGPTDSVAVRRPPEARPRRMSANTVADQLARDRQAAEWVFSMTGSIGYMAPGATSEQRARHMSELPTEFALTLIDLRKKGQVTDESLAHLEGLMNLRTLYLESSPITDAGLEHVRGLSNLNSLTIENTKVTDAGMAHVNVLRNLTELNLASLPITDAGLKKLNGLTNLTSLSLGTVNVTDAGMAHLSAFPALRNLRIHNVPLTDATIAALRAALPNCQISK
jgi:hypothetical protein